MKKGFFSCAAIAALMLLLSAGSVFAADENTGFYVGISGGYVIPQTLTITPKDSDTGKFDTTLNNGWFVGVKSGWNTPFTNRIMALEMEYNYIRNNFDNTKYIPEIDGTLDGTVSVHALLFNVKARYPEGRFHPYAGAGLGWALVQVGDLTGTSGGVKGDIGNGFCWQLLAGVDFDITPNFGVGIGYKYLATSPTIGSSDNGHNKIYADTDYKASMITAGFTFTF